MKNNKAIIITIGDELLIGQTIDTNSAWMAQRLNEIGIEVVRRIAVGDTRQDIIAALDDAKVNAGLVLITGGLGPTADDITKPLLCEYFGSKLVLNNEALDNVKRIFSRRNLPLLERNIKQAEVPDNCIVLQNRRGTAPGMWFEQEEVIIISLPGVPHEVMGIMEDAVLPVLSQAAPAKVIVHRHLLTSGLGESFLAERIADIENALPPHIKLAYLPNNWILKLRLTAKGIDEAALITEAEYYQQCIRERISDYFISFTDEPFEKILHREFTKENKTLALAESCTGGYLGHTLTQTDGSSQYFMGSIVSYDASVKETVLKIPKEDIIIHGEVSEAIAMQMAIRVRALLKTSVGFGITGWLSPSSPEAGTVWMAVSNAHRTVAKKFHFPYDRERNKEVALQMAMLTIWKFINGKAI